MFRSASQFDKLLEKATSSLKLEPDWPVIMQICDQIRQGDVQPKYALAAIKKKMLTPNPHVALFSLNVLEAVVKNCGCLIHDEIGTKAYMEQLRETIKTVSNENVKNKLLELIRAWAYAFRNSPKYRAVQDTVILMKAEGFNFPQLKESDAMFSADTAPEWADGDCCHRCRVTFSLVQRKHHCRACGQVFCGQCTNKSCTLPKFGIEKEVRVCEACYEKFSKPTTTTTSKADDLPAEYLSSSLAQQSQAPPPRKSEAELKEEEELQLAIALSQSEAEHKSIATQRTTSIATRTKSYSPPPKLSTSPEADPELARYLNRSYWQQQQQQQQQQNHEYSNASAPIMTATINQNSILEQNGVEDIEMDEFVVALQSQVEIFVNRMKSNSSRGRSIANDSSVQTLFINITTMHSRLLRYIQQQDDRRVYFEGLQDKLAQVKDARAALDALREEHREKLRREAEIAERQRQLQMAQKLDIMRKKKQEYLQYQRQLALQKIQEQEREMQLRQEQQKQQYLIGAQYGTLPYMGPGYDMPGRYPAPGSQAPPFAHFPPTGPPVPMDGSMPRGGIPMSPPHMPSDPQGMVMHPGMMRPPGMVPPNMVPLGPPGAHPQMIPPNGGPMGPQAFSPPTSMPGTQTLPRTMSVPGPAMMSGSHTLPREHIPIQMNGPQPDHQLGAHPSLGQPMPMPLPGQKEPFQHQLPGQPPHSVQPQSIPMGPGMPHMSNQPLLTTMPQASLPSHIPPQGVPQMIPAQTPQQPMIAPQFPQVPTSQPQPPPQPQQEEKTAELISFD